MSEVVTKELPVNWEWSTLGDVCEKPQYGWTTKASQEGDLHLLRTTDITSGQINWDTVPYCVEEPEDKEKYLIKDGDIVVSRAGSVGVSYLISNPEPSVFASYLIRFKPLIDRKYVFYFLKSPAYWNAISEKSAGIALQNVNASKLREIDIPVAPPEQQKRIVAKIEELFSHIDAGIEALKKAKQLLKQYRQSVLKAAVTGELTKEWREANKEKLEPASQLLERILKERRLKWEEQQLEQFKAKGKMPKDNKWKEKYKELSPVTYEEIKSLPKIPDDWVYTRLGNVIEEPKYGTSKKCSYDAKGIGVLRIPNVAHGVIDSEDLKYAKFDDAEVETYKLNEGDILTIRSNGSINLVGKCALIDASDTKYLYAGYLIRLRPNSEVVVGSYLINVLNSIQLRQQIESKAKSTSGVNNINSGELQSLVIPMCSKEEQSLSIKLVDKKLSSSDRLLKELRIQQLKAEKDKQSILASAFTGGL